MQGLVWMITIAKRSMSEEIVSFLRKENVPLTLGRYGRGTANAEMLNYLGLGEREKCVLFSTLPKEKAPDLLRKIERKMNFGNLGNGLSFTIPIRSVGGKTALRYLGGELESEKGEENMAKVYEHELIIVVTNRGYVDDVMDAARSAGANGGTVVHARGTGVESAEKFFGVTMGAEKEMIYIVSEADKKQEIMRAIMNKAGINSKAQSVLFSLPVSDVAGMLSRE